MNQWKYAIRMAAYETSFSIKHGFLTVLFAAFVVSNLFRALGEKDFNITVGPDLMFIVFFSILGIVGKRNRITPKPVNDHVIAAPGISMLRSLPASRSLIAKQQVSLFLMLNVPLQIVLLLIVLLFNSMGNPLHSVGASAAWITLWVSFGIIAGGTSIAFSVGRNVSWVYYFAAGLLTYFALAVLLSFIIIQTGSNLIHLSILAANSAPLLTSAISLLLAASVLIIWYRLLIHRISKTDFY